MDCEYKTGDRELGEKRIDVRTISRVGSRATLRARGGAGADHSGGTCSRRNTRSHCSAFSSQRRRLTPSPNSTHHLRARRIGIRSQFESQAMRFASNGYPRAVHRRARVRLLADQHHPARRARGARRADRRLQAETGRAKVDLLGHSLGTFVSQTYLSTPRAPRTSRTTSTSTAARRPRRRAVYRRWRSGRARTAGGLDRRGENVTLADQEHIECATSAEAFFEMYSLLPRRGAGYDRHRAEPPGQVRSGAGELLPSNAGIAGATLEIWEVDGATGFRTGRRPWRRA